MRVTSAILVTCLSAAPALADCKAEINATIADMMAAGPYRVEMTSSGGGTTTTSTAEVILPDTFHVTSDQMEMILIKKKAWMKMGGSWQVMPGEAAAMMSNMIAAGMKDGMTAAKNVKCLGSQSYQGDTFTTYQYDVSGTFAGIASTSTITMYKGDNAVPHWLVIEGEAMGMKSKTVQKLTPDSTIAISPPK